MIIFFINLPLKFLIVKTFTIMKNYTKSVNNVKITPPPPPFVENKTNDFSNGTANQLLKHTVMKSNYFTKTLLPNFKTLGLLFLTVLLFSACSDDPLPPNTGKRTS